MEIQNTEVRKSKDDQDQMKIDLNQYCANWIWRATECLVEAPDFEASPKWSAKRLNVSVEKIVDAFEGLERLGYIVRNGNTFAKPKEYVAVDTAHLTREDLLSFHSKLAPQIITKLKSKDKFTTWFFNADEALITEFAPKFMKLFKELNDEGNRRQCKEVYASEISFAQLTEGQNIGGIQ